MLPAAWSRRQRWAKLGADELSPGAVTHHLTALERAGLIIREPHGRHVLAPRTARGTSLLGLYEP